jgi:hypothetical protein
MERAFANAVILEALKRDPERVAEVIANVARAMQAKGHSEEEIEAAIEELLKDLEAKPNTRH